ncbi:hypothetical protein AJ78_02310 [Emergomyces pasteurianus Ep9510]|uniref:Endopolyphosphatase n=1 Tax=Emergomyces pasteurianus Ep9510 TaxID=1447872 RepID=A0A1J9QBI0_9EURO|nr:hypothetical protein AJ78_02310 [Emergomyces pasteurianus Ep9510]
MIKLALVTLLALCSLQAFAGVQYPPELKRDDLHEAKTHKLHGRFLHITDIHVDTNYKPNSNSDEDHECHSGSGNAALFGTPGSTCDSPLTLVNATFSWIQANLADSIDFVVWTGDSVRHDNDERIPRMENEVLSVNQLLADKFHDIFSTPSGNKEMRIPVIPTIGNNDVMPHNIFKKGPNSWTKKFASIWEPFIPEEQRHSFVQGGWFYVEVIPHKLAVFSLNTMYFYNSNSAVDGCEHEDQPGYEHMEWLRVQLQFIRKRNMKAILIGHVPPARTDSKKNWDETCWQKYTLWLQQYRDIIVGSMFGHMNIDHFMLQDTANLKIGDKGADQDLKLAKRPDLDDDQVVSSQSRMSYLTNLRYDWSQLPSPPDSSSLLHLEDDDDSPSNGEYRPGSDLDLHHRGKKKQLRKYLEAIGGPWAERYSVSLVSPSIIPNYYPTLRVIEYNISGVEDAMLWSEVSVNSNKLSQLSLPLVEDLDSDSQGLSGATKKKRKKKKKPKKRKKSKFKVPKPPSPTAPPGPAYSNQPLTFLSYTQYFCNITELDNTQTIISAKDRLHDQKQLGWREYRTRGSGNGGHGSKNLSFNVFYDTKTDEEYNLKDLTVRSILRLARGIADKHNSRRQGIEKVLHGTNTRCRDGKTEGSEQSLRRPANEKGKPSLDSLCTVESLPPATSSPESLWSVFVRRAFVGFFDGDV